MLHMANWIQGDPGDLRPSGVVAEPKLGGVCGVVLVDDGDYAQSLMGSMARLNQKGSQVPIQRGLCMSIIYNLYTYIIFSVSIYIYIEYLGDR